MPTKKNFRVRSQIVAMLFAVSAVVCTMALAQTAPNTVITSQAKAVFQFKAFTPDTIKSNVVQFSVLDAPNFEISFSEENNAVFGKETVAVRIIYKNVGNKKADTASVEAFLPQSGMRFLAGSTTGTISGSSVKWKLFTIPSGKSDSVMVRVVVDSGLVLNSELAMQAEMSWGSSLVSASKAFVISTFPRLALSIAPLSDIVGSGRTITYRMTVRNSGNLASTNTILYDTISAYGMFSSANVNPDSLAATKQLVKWNLGSIPGFSSKELLVNVVTLPNIGYKEIRNSAAVFAANAAKGDYAFTTNTIVPIRPASMTLSASPTFIFGQRNKDSSRVTVVVKDSSGELLPDGATVQITTSTGTFSTNAAEVATVIRNGAATATLRSIDVSNDISKATITAIAGASAFGTIQDTTAVFFYPGAVTGKIASGLDHVPFAGAIVQVLNSVQKVMGADTTRSDGKFFIALNKDVQKYVVRMLVIDKYGDSITTFAEIDPSRFPLPPVDIPNIISGRIEYKNSGGAVAAANVTVFLDSLISNNAQRKARTKDSPFGALARVQERKTDANGKFTFDNLRPSRYVLSLDSAQFPNFKGYTFLADTASGMFTMNLGLEIGFDSSVTVTTSAPAAANAGDTVTIGIGISNNGTAEHHNVTVFDTLSAFARYISATQGKFASVTYDSTSRVIRWQRDTVQTLVKDSVIVRALLSRNIPDSTKIVNRVWFVSHLTAVSAEKSITVRSKGEVQFTNRFIMPGDTLVAGDSIRHVFKIRNIGTDSLRGIRIVDTLFSAGASGLTLAKSAVDSVKILDSVSTIHISAIAPGKEDSVSLKLVTDYALRHGMSISSHAYVMKNDSVLARHDTAFIVNENPGLSTFLRIVKTANKKVAEIGDIVTYQVQISNASPQAIRNIGVYDLLPYAFQYIKNSARFNGKAIEPYVHPQMNRLQWNLSDTIPTTKHGILVYQLAVGADAMESEGMNTAVASAVAGYGTTIVSAPSQWQVTVRPGVFTEKGLIIGKVFYDDNRNTFQDAGENGQKGIELWMEDGTKIITGDDGKYSVPEVKPGQHVLRVNELTLLKNTELLVGSIAFANDPSSRFVRVTEGGIAKANFYLKRNIADTVEQAVSKVNRLFAVRQAKPKYLYIDSLRNIHVDTVQMYVSFSYSGSKPVQSITISDQLDERFTLVPNSAAFNGRKTTLTAEKNMIRWKLGAAREITKGVLSYKVRVNSIPASRTILSSTSAISVTDIDSVRTECGPFTAENVILDTVKNRIETSKIVLTAIEPRESDRLPDSVSIAPGDELFVRTSLFIDPKKKIKDVRIIDSLQYAFTINEQSFSVNGIPLPARNLTLRTRSSSLSSSEKTIGSQIDFTKISSMDITGLVRGGKNEITYTLSLQSARKDTVYKQHSFALITNDFDEKNLVRSNDVTIRVRSNINTTQLALETTYVDILRPVIRTEEKTAEAIKLIELLGSGSAKGIVIEGIAFIPSKTVLTDDAKIILDRLAVFMDGNTDIKLQINGYTDNTGNATANRKMSLNRANEVASYLISKGIASSRLTTQGFGPSNPIASNKTLEGRTKNRRIEFIPLK
ncbi:MAG: OmpA family protein [Bacteroidota bacterium]